MHIIKKLKQLFIGIILAITSHSMSASWSIIFDLPNTLIKPNKVTFFKDVIGFTGIAYTLWDWKNPFELEELMYKMLDTMGKQNPENGYVAKSPEGRTLPKLYCDVLTTTITPPQAAKLAKQHISALAVKRYFANNREQSLMHNIMDAVFDAAGLAKHTEPIPEAITLVTDCNNQVGKDNLYIVANWDKFSFTELFKMTHAQPLFKFFSTDNIYLSSTSKLLLPNSACFEPLVKFHNIDPRKSVFITGVAHHVQAARSFGMKTVLIQDEDFDTVRLELKMLGIL